MIIHIYIMPSSNKTNAITFHGKEYKDNIM